jgi:predicted Fe-S protein YdhL (DUF1289 family)
LIAEPIECKSGESQPMPISSPCVGICRIDAVSGFCIGCARTRQEIKDWRDADDTALARIWNELPNRRAQLGVSLHRLNWTRDDICQFVIGTLRPNGGTWICGTFGAIAEFCVGSDERVNVVVEGSRCTAETRRGAIRLDVSDDVHALALARDELGGPKAIVFVVPRNRPGLTRNANLTAMGLDRDAIRASGCDEALYDLGLGMDAARFCIRTSDDSLARALNAHIGRRWPEVLAGLGGQILQAAPARVVLSDIGRIEVFTPIPPPGGTSPDGPHTHFLPAHISSGRETPPGTDLPANYRPCAMFYPQPEMHAGPTCEGT